ncbi:hydroxycarboxylic acid receptor 1-2 [Neosynchiropus ocellatus]
MNASPECCVFQTPRLDQVMPPVLVLEVVLGLAGNSVALLMLVLRMDKRRPGAVFLTQLAVADTMVLFCLPFRAQYYRQGKDWLLGDAACRVVLFLLAANRAAGIFFLTAVTVDRYCRIVHPLSRINLLGPGYAVGVSGFLWAVVLLATGHLLAERRFLGSDERTQCESFNICMGSDPPSTWHSVFFVVHFVLPTAVVAFCTARIAGQLCSRPAGRGRRIRRAVRFVLAVALVFVVCFLPSAASRIAIWVLKVWYRHCRHFEGANLAFYGSICLTYLHSALNPLVYYFSTPAFSGSFRRLWHRLQRREARRSVYVLRGPRLQSRRGAEPPGGACAHASPSGLAPSGGRLCDGKVGSRLRDE